MLHLILIEDAYCDVNDYQADALDMQGNRWIVHWPINREYERECEREGIDIDTEWICDWDNPSYAINTETLENEYDIDVI